MKVKIKKLHPDAIIPKYQTPGSAGFDFHALEDYEIHVGQTKIIRTGLAFEVPFGYELQIIPRSGISFKTSLRIANSPGCIDSDFRNEINIIVENIIKNMYFDSTESGSVHNLCFDAAIYIKKGERIAQGKIVPVIQAEFLEVEELSETERKGGLGSTGVK